MVAYAKANPGKLSYASGLVGISRHLTMEWLKQRLKFDILHIPFVNASQGTNQVMAGEIAVNVTNMPFVIGPRIQADAGLRDRGREARSVSRSCRM